MNSPIVGLMLALMALTLVMLLASDAEVVTQFWASLPPWMYWMGWGVAGTTWVSGVAVVVDALRRTRARRDGDQ